MRDAPAGGCGPRSSGIEQAIVVRAEGEVDLDNAEQLAAALRTARRARRGRVVLDLLGVPFMDSSGLQVLLVASAELGERLSLVAEPAARRSRACSSWRRCAIGSRSTRASSEAIARPARR